MAQIKSKWTKPEKRIHNLLKGNKVRHVMHPDLPGKPDAFLKDFNAVIFIDGCFWHKCPIHGHIPQQNKSYWEKKIQKNVQRDEAYTNVLESTGFTVIRLWEHDVMSKKFKLVSIMDRLRAQPAKQEIKA